MCKDCPYIINGIVVKDGVCDDCLEEVKRTLPKSNKKKSTKHSRRIKYNRHLERLCEEQNAYSIWLHKYNKPNPFYVKKSYGRSAYVRVYKHYSNKKIRMYKKSYIPKGQWCHKLFDFWWTID